ncbi:MAG: galactose mutarotase [Polyangiales bacterium]
MPSTQHRSSLHKAIGELYVLNDERADASVVVAPQRGAIVTSMRVGGRDLLYMQDATLSDPAQNVRGGIPVLFPTPGKLTNDELHWGGRVGTQVKQHGFGRILDWNVLDTPPGGLTLGIQSNAWTMGRFPWNFRAQLELQLELTRLRLRLSVENTDQVPLPMAIGFHPYFHVKHPHKPKLQIPTQATQAFDNVQKQVVPFAGFDLAQPEVDLHLLDHGSTQCSLQLPDGGRIELRASDEFKFWVVWTLEKKDFVCVEPWSARADALNTGEDVLEVAPGQTHVSTLELEYFPA